jgi:ketosteroid isomerase-like protein
VLPEWGKDIAENKAIGTRATVEFRFTSRQSDAESAFETGVFKYTVIDKSGRSTPSYRRLESLMVKHQGKWRIVMERQLEAVTEATWNSMRP